MSLKTLFTGWKKKVHDIHMPELHFDAHHEVKKHDKKHHAQKKNVGNKLVRKATAYLWKHSWSQFLGISIVVAFLLFFLHLFLTTAYLTQKVSNDITQRLGFYFYIAEPGQNGLTINESEIFSRVTKMKDELTSQGLEVEYYSKEDALKMLQTRIP